MAGLWRQAGWGLAAVAALFVAVLSTRDDGAMERVGSLFVSLNLMPAPAAKRQFDAEAAARQLAHAVRGLVDDRDRLASRLAALERDMGDMTGSIKSQIEAVKAAKAEPPPWPDAAPPVPMTPADIAAMIKTVTPTPDPAAAAARAEPAGCRRQSVTVEPASDSCSYRAGRDSCAGRHGLRRRYRHRDDHQSAARALDLASHRPSGIVRGTTAAGQLEAEPAHQSRRTAPDRRPLLECRRGGAILRFHRAVPLDLRAGDVRRQPSRAAVTGAT